MERSSQRATVSFVSIALEKFGGLVGHAGALAAVRRIDGDAVMDSLEAPRAGGKVDDGFVDLGRRWFAARSRLSRLQSPHRIGGLPLLGSPIAFRRDRLALLERAAAMGDIAALELGVMPAVLVTSPQLAHEVLATRAADSVQAPTLRIVGEPLLGRGVLTAEGADHVRQRRLLAPAFSAKRVAAYAREMVSGTERVVARWDDAATIDVTAEMMKLTLAIAARVLFSADIEGEASAFGRALTVAMETSSSSATLLCRFLRRGRRPAIGGSGARWAVSIARRAGSSTSAACRASHPKAHELRDVGARVGVDEGGDHLIERQVGVETVERDVLGMRCSVERRRREEGFVRRREVDVPIALPIHHVRRQARVDLDPRSVQPEGRR